MKSFHLGRLVAVLLGLALVAAACSSSSDEPEATETETEGTTATTEAAPEEEEETTDDTEAMEEGGSAMEGGLSGLKVIDDNTFTVELENADAEFPIQLSYNAYYPLPSVAYDDPTGFEEAPIGNGPFMMDGVWNHDIDIKVVPYADYAGADAADVSSVTFNIYEDSSTTGYLDLQAGVNDLVTTVPAEQIAAAQAEFGDRFAESPNTGFYYYGFPTYLEDQYPLDLRRALSMALDRELLIDAILDGSRLPAHSVVPPSLGGRDEVCGNWNFDADGAREAFEAFGGLDALGDEPLIVWFNTSTSHEQIAEAVTGQWRDVLGIENIEFQNLEFSEYLPLLDNKEVTGVFRLGWGMDYPSPLNFLEPLYASYNIPPVGSNNVNYENPAFDEALAEGKAAVAATGELSDGIPFYEAAEDLLCEDTQVLPIYFSKNQFAWNDTVENVYITAFGRPNYTEIIGGDIALAIGEPEHLFPTNSNESEGSKVLDTLFKGLVEFDAKTTEPYNEVAESITSDDGGKTWTIVLKDGWTFHDGEPVTAASFVNAWNFGADGANAQQNNSFFSNMVGYADLNETEG
ncbi:MAG: ABC transporter substrate-binding protein [Acidimicrobiales bacterium]